MITPVTETYSQIGSVHRASRTWRSNCERRPRAVVSNASGRMAAAYLGLRGRLRQHVRLARWTLPIWLYVSVTGVLVYVMLYRMNHG